MVKMVIFHGGEKGNAASYQMILDYIILLHHDKECYTLLNYILAP